MSRFTQDDVRNFKAAVIRRVVEIVGVPLLRQKNEMARTLHREFGFAGTVATTRDLSKAHTLMLLLANVYSVACFAAGSTEGIPQYLASRLFVIDGMADKAGNKMTCAAQAGQIIGIVS